MIKRKFYFYFSKSVLAVTGAVKVRARQSDSPWHAYLYSIGRMIVNFSFGPHVDDIIILYRDVNECSACGRLERGLALSDLSAPRCVGALLYLV